jgi:hypothetical protein
VYVYIWCAYRCSKQYQARENACKEMFSLLWTIFFSSTFDTCFLFFLNIVYFPLGKANMSYAGVHPFLITDDVLPPRCVLNKNCLWITTTSQLIIRQILPHSFSWRTLFFLLLFFFSFSFLSFFSFFFS